MLFRATLVLLSQIYAFAALDEVYRSQTHESPVTKIMTSDGISVSGDRSGNLVVYKQTATGFIKKELESNHNKAINSLHILDGKIMASGDAQGKIVLWDTITSAEIVLLEQHTVPVVALHLKSDSNDGLEVYSFDRNGNGFVTSLTNFKVTSKKAFSVNGNYRAAKFVETATSVDLAIGERAGAISRYNISNNSELKAENSARNPVVDIACDSFQKSCAYATRDKTIKVFDSQMQSVKNYSTISNKVRLASAQGVLYYVDNDELNSVRARSATKIDKVTHGLFNVETISVNDENRLVVLGDRNGEVAFYKVTDTTDNSAVDDSLKKAICSKDIDAIRDLVKNGSNVLAVDSDGNNAFMNVYSCKMYPEVRHNILKVLLEGNVVNVTQYNRDGKNFYDLAQFDRDNIKLLENHIVSLSEELSTEIEYENIAEVERLLSIGADINFLDYFGNTPLMAAAQLGNTELVTLLLKHKWIDVDKKNELDETVLDLDISDEIRDMIEAHKAKIQMGRELLEQGITEANLLLVKKAVNEYGISIIVEDSIYNKLSFYSDEYPNILKILLTKNTDVLDYYLSQGGFTSFYKKHYDKAIKYALDIESLDTLIKYNADIEENKKSCNNLLVRSAFENLGLDTYKKLFLEYGFSENSKSCRSNDIPLSFLEIIVLNEDKFSFRWFLENTNVDLSDTASGYSLTSLSIAKGNMTILRALLAKGIKIEVDELPNVIKFNDDGSILGGSTLIKILKKNIDFNKVGAKLLYDAIHAENDKLTELFIELGAKLTSKGKNGNNQPIMAIIEKENSKLLKQYLDEGGNLNSYSVGEDLYSPYQLAIGWGQFEWLKTHSKVEPIDRPNKFGAKFTHMACFGDHVELALSFSSKESPLVLDKEFERLPRGEACGLKVKEIKKSFKDILSNTDRFTKERMNQLLDLEKFYDFESSFYFSGKYHKNLYSYLIREGRTLYLEHFYLRGDVSSSELIDKLEDGNNDLLMFIVKVGAHNDNALAFAKKVQNSEENFWTYKELFNALGFYNNSSPRLLYELSLGQYALKTHDGLRLEIAIFDGFDFDKKYLGKKIAPEIFYHYSIGENAHQVAYNIEHVLPLIRKYGFDYLKISRWDVHEVLVKEALDEFDEKKIRLLKEYVSILAKTENINSYHMQKKASRNFLRLLTGRYGKDLSMLKFYVKEMNLRIDLFAKELADEISYDSDFIESYPLLLKAGFNPNYKIGSGHLMLNRAAKYCNYDVVKFLLENGANPRLKEDYSGKTAYRASRNSYCDNKKSIYRLIKKYR